ncbi:MAG: hypothetical protein PWP27_1685 [Clostridiales bacterium]|jgi:hypothetical protein|nr:hypothetical protein [Clostridiales bacterium]MDK2933875.1 hypothetical protein [Clostridiales bacterium]
MNKNKHVIPDIDDTFAERVKRGARKNRTNRHKTTIYGPDNEPMEDVDIEVSREFVEDRNRR